MKRVIVAAVGFLLASAGAAGAQSYYGGGPTPAYASGGGYLPAPTPGGYVPGGYLPSPTPGGYGPPCAPGWRPGPSNGTCICDYPTNFYPGYPGGGYDFHVQAPGARVIGTPVTIASGTIYVDGPPIYVQAPPVHVQAPNVVLRRPQVIVQPSEVTVEPPNVQVEPCPEGSTCEGMAGQSYTGGSAHYRSVRR